MADNIFTQTAEGIKSGLFGLAGQQAAGPKGATAAKTKTTGKFVKPADVVYSDPDAFYQQIVSAGSTTDPTTSSTVIPNNISPLTNQAIGGTAGTPGSPYTMGTYTADFLGGNGASPRLGANYDEKYKRYYISMTDAYGTKHDVAIIGDPKNPSAYRVVDKLQGIQEILGEYQAKPGGIAALKEELWRKGSLTGAKGKASIANGKNIDSTFIAALSSYVDELTFSNFNNADTKQFKTFGDILDSTKSFAGTRTSMNYTYTPKSIAAQDITGFIQTQLGRSATSQEVSDYTAALQTFEREHPQKSIVTTDALGMERNRVSYTGASEQDKIAVKVAVLAKSLTAAGVDPSTISKAGGAIAQGMDLLKQTAGAYGLVGYDDKKALNTMIGTLKPGGDIKAEQEKMKQVAKVTYKNLASSIDQGLTVKDVADQYAYYNQKILEKPGVTDVFDPYIQKALHNDGKSGLMSTNDYVTYLKNQPEWAKTQNAREEAASYANTILKQFGLIA